MYLDMPVMVRKIKNGKLLWLPDTYNTHYESTLRTDFCNPLGHRGLGHTLHPRSYWDRPSALPLLGVKPTDT